MPSKRKPARPTARSTNGTLFDAALKASAAFQRLFDILERIEAKVDLEAQHVQLLRLEATVNKMAGNPALVVGRLLQTFPGWLLAGLGALGGAVWGIRQVLGMLGFPH